MVPRCGRCPVPSPRVPGRRAQGKFFTFTFKFYVFSDFETVISRDDSKLLIVVSLSLINLKIT